MRRLRTIAVAAGVAIIALLIIIAVVLTVTWPRSVVVGAAIRFILGQRGLHVAHGRFHAGRDVLEIDDLDVKDRFGGDFLRSKRILIRFDPAGLIGRSDRRFGLRSVDVDEPMLRFLRASDGSWNVSALFGGPKATPATTRVAQPYRFSLAVRNGDIRIEDPSALVSFARALTLAGLDGSIKLDEGAISTGALKATLRTARGQSIVRGSFFENDPVAFAHADIGAAGVPVAPLIDGLVPSKDFAFEDGRVDLKLHFFALDYTGSAPSWHASGDALLYPSTVRINPLIVPVRRLAGAFHFEDGWIVTHRLTATAANVPITARGAMQIIGGVRMGLALAVRGAWENQRHAFAFMSNLPLSGSFDAAVRLDGPINDVHIKARVLTRHGHYGDIAISTVDGGMFFSGGHIVLNALDYTPDGSRMWMNGDLNLTTPQTPLRLLVEGSAPSDVIPVATNLNSGGVIGMLGVLYGPINHLSSTGFVRLAGGTGLLARGILTTSPQETFLGPVIASSGEGEGDATLAADIVRPPGQAPLLSGELFANRARLHIAGGRAVLAEVPTFAVALPSLDMVVNGAVVAVGQPRAPALAFNGEATGLTAAGVRLGTVSVQGAGHGGQLIVRRARINGPDVHADATGTVAFDSHLALRGSALQGDGYVNLPAIAQAWPRLHLKGAARGHFYEVSGAGSILAAANATTEGASVSGVPITAADTALAVRDGSVSALVANARVAGGNVSALGSMAAANSHGASATPGTQFEALASGINTGQLSSFGGLLSGGSAVAIANVRGTLSAPEISGAAVVNGPQSNAPVAGDLDVTYRDGTLYSRNSRILLDNNLANINGSIAGIGSGGLSSLGLDLRVHMFEGDLASLNRFVGRKAPLTGATDLDLAVNGPIARPAVTGYIDTDIGTIRGVEFDELNGNVVVRSGALHLRNGTVSIGSSQFGINGDAAPGLFSLHAASPNVDMSDFNNFFAGSDVFAGSGAFRLAFETSNAGLKAAGEVRLNDASFRDYPLGHIEMDFSSNRGTMLTDMKQDGPVGASALSGSIAFNSYTAGLPDFATARYNVKVDLRHVDLDDITPLIHQEDLGLTGSIDASGALAGTLRRPVLHASVSLLGGHLKKMPITGLQANLASDGSTLSVSQIQASLPFLTATGDGSFDFGRKRIGGNINLDVTNLAAFSAAVRKPGLLNGSARASVRLSGLAKHPLMQATLNSGRGELLGVGLESAKIAFAYSPGEVSIGDSSINLADGGRLTFQGSLPIQLQPLGLGPRERPVGIAIEANNVGLAGLNPLTGRYASLTGVLNAKAQITGTAGNPQLAGSASFRNAAIHSTIEAVPLTNASADLSLANDTIALPRLHGQLGSGTVDASGAAHVVPAAGLRKSAGLQFSSHVLLRGAQLNFPNWLSGTLDADLSLTKTANTPYLAGSAGISDAVAPFTAILNLANSSSLALAASKGTERPPGVPPLLPGHTIVYGGSIFGKETHTLTSVPLAEATPPPPSLPPVDFNLALQAGKNVQVRGGTAVNLTVGGAITLTGSLANPVVAGEFHAIRGQIGYFDTTFRLLSGTVTFIPSEGLLPTLDASAVTNVSGAEITLRLTGRVDNLNTDLSSDPQMTRDQILATLLHAPQLSELATGTPSQAQAQLLATAQSYFNAELARSLLFPFESAVAQSLNLEQVALIFDPQGNLAVEVRTRVTPNISALYRSSLNIPVTQAYGVSYRLRDYLALEMLETQPQLGQPTGVINLRYLFQ